VNARKSEAPRYVHDCDLCVFLGSYLGDDLYYCPGREKTVVVRISSDGPDYISGAVFAPYNDAIREAVARAHAEGYYVFGA